MMGPLENVSPETTYFAACSVYIRPNVAESVIDSWRGFVELS